MSQGINVSCDPVEEEESYRNKKKKKKKKEERNDKSKTDSNDCRI